MIGAKREAIVALRDKGEISPEVMRRIERDLEESRIGGWGMDRRVSASEVRRLSLQCCVRDVVGV